MVAETGVLRILNVAAGDVTLRVDGADEAETETAARLVAAMLRDGYSILVECDDGRVVRASGFDPLTLEWLVAEPPPAKGRAGRRRVLTRRARATAVAPSAGG